MFAFTMKTLVKSKLRVNSFAKKLRLTI